MSWFNISRSSTLSVSPGPSVTGDSLALCTVVCWQLTGFWHIVCCCLHRHHDQYHNTSASLHTPHAQESLSSILLLCYVYVRSFLHFISDNDMQTLQLHSLTLYHVTNTAITVNHCTIVQAPFIVSATSLKCTVGSDLPD